MSILKVCDTDFIYSTDDFDTLIKGDQTEIIIINEISSIQVVNAVINSTSFVGKFITSSILPARFIENITELNFVYHLEDYISSYIHYFQNYLLFEDVRTWKYWSKLTLVNNNLHLTSPLIKEELIKIHSEHKFANFGLNEISQLPLHRTSIPIADPLSSGEQNLDKLIIEYATDDCNIDRLRSTNVRINFNVNKNKNKNINKNKYNKYLLKINF